MCLYMPLWVACLWKYFFFFFAFITHTILFTCMRSVIFVKVTFKWKNTVVYFINKRFLILISLKMTSCKTPESNVKHLECKRFTSSHISKKVGTLLCKYQLHSSQSESILFLCMLRFRLNFETISVVYLIFFSCWKYK